MTEQAIDTYYPHLREVLDARFHALSDDQLDAAFESAFGEGVTPAEYEEFFGKFGAAAANFLKKAAPVAATIGQGALSGASAGSVAGPWGALGGAVLGGLGAGLKSQGRGPARDVGNVLSGVVNTAGALTGRGAAAGLPGMLGRFGQLAGRGSPAAGQILGLLDRPELRQALTSLARGRNAPVMAGGAPVPANDIVGMLGALAREAEAEALEWSGSVPAPGYLLDTHGEFVVDPSREDQRAGRVLQLLRTGTQESWGGAEDEAFDEGGEDEADYDEFLDPEFEAEGAEDLGDLDEFAEDLGDLVEDVDYYELQRM